MLALSDAYRLDDRNRTDPFFACSGYQERKTSQTVLKVKKDVAQMTEQLRYGEDNMPSGSLAQAASLEQGDEPRLRVKTEQIKPLYLKGFTGSVYENDSWKPLAKAAYGGKQMGIF